MKPPAVLYWYDPMVPQQHFEKPGKSPFMDMQLVPRYADESVAAAGVRIAPQVLQNLGVRLATVERLELSGRIEASGIIGFNERDVAVVQSRAAGYVQRLWPLAPGDRVHAGNPLAELVVPDWSAAEQEFIVAGSTGDAGLVAAARDRLRALGIDANEMSRLESGGAARAQFVLRAPISGVVQSLELRTGMTLATGQTLLRINGLDPVWLEVAVPESQAATIHEQDRVEVHLASPDAPSIGGRVSALLPALNDATRTLRVRVELANPHGALRPGQSAQVTLNAASVGTALVVPTEAVIRTGKRTLVMVAEQSRFRPVEVTPGREAGDRTEIIRGLTEGQQVVASGQFLLDSEASLRGIGTTPAENGP
jgi:Cu(I)/Ag(I) efflux system membrane fusion protein